MIYTPHIVPADDFNITAELESVLQGVGLSINDCGGSIDFIGQDPIVFSPFRYAAAAGIGLVSKAIAIAKIWQLRGGSPQNIVLDLRKALHRLSPFYLKKWELLKNPFCAT